MPFDDDIEGQVLRGPLVWVGDSISPHQTRRSHSELLDIETELITELDRRGRDRSHAEARP